MGASHSGFERSLCTLANAYRLAVDSIRARKLRSFLTLLGIIIGVGSVVMVGAAIEGLGLYAEQSTSKIFGSESYLVAQVGTAGNMREYLQKLRRNKRLRAEDYQYLQALTGDRILYSPYRQRPEEVRQAGLKYEDAVVLGAGANLPEIRDVTLVDGRFFTPEEERTRQAVCVIGYDARTALFPASSAVGRTIKIRGIDFLVLGEQEKLGSAFGRSQDNQIYIPYTVFTRMFGTGQSIAVFARPRPEAGMKMDEAIDITRVALRARFKTPPNKADTFEVVTPDAVRTMIDQILSMISAVVVPVTCISLVVGGIVIMNIMLVSVTERTHEIGVRKSLGARRFDVMLQFLLESVLMSMVGGIVGVGLGAAMTEVLSRAFDISMRITPFYVMLAVLVSSAVGIASGWYPASRASKLDPVAALRAE
ncbi:MAG: ABC transporter permease [Acidobacteriales bacterium]|nr:ABC transporter permease [Terriglobales bacterium]